MAEKRASRKVLPISILLLACGCVTAVAVLLGYFFLFPRTVEARPVVLIISPASGEKIAISRPVAIHAVANDAQKIKRLELWVDGQLYKAQDSSLPAGTSPFPLVSFWQPTSPGAHIIIARAFTAQGNRSQTTIEVNAVETLTESGDTDNDGVADPTDACPDETGSPLALGCPDADGDGLEDSADACPTTPGPFDHDGCPLPDDIDGDGLADAWDECPAEAGTLATEGCPDADGDTIPDQTDACPDQPGPPDAPAGAGCPALGASDQDGDGIPDSEDRCQDEGGSPETDGCPDTDGDGVPDSADACPEDPGLPGDEGCPVPVDSPDSDGDGVRDIDDACPFVPGLPALDGCPESVAPGDSGTGEDTDSDQDPGSAGDEGGAGGDGDGGADPGDSDDTGDTSDADGDGVPDDSDLCPEEVGLPEHDGCPIPGADEDDDGIPDDEEGPADESGPTFPDMDLSTVMEGVEFQAISFSVSHDLDGVYCYPRLTGLPAERYVFEPQGERRWDIAADLGSRTLSLLPTEDLQVDIECGGDIVDLGPEGGWGAYFDLGATTRSHPRTDWDGHVITARSSGGDGGRWFEAQYRICADACDDTTFPPPVISLFHYGGDDELIIMWRGDRDEIDGFWVYADGHRAFRLPADTTSHSIAGYEPLCGTGRRDYHVTAYQGSRESPASNLVYWSRQPCPRVVRLTFDNIETFALEDERRMDGQLGPVFGSFWAQGSEEATLSFHGSDYPHGYKFSPYSTVSIQGMFDQIGVWVVNNSGPFYQSPASNTVTVALGPHDDLTFGGVIYDQDYRVYQEVFLGTRSIPASDLVPGRYTIRDGQFELSVLVDVLVGPEAGDRPDLAITDVDDIDGQLRIHVFNNAAALENRNIDVHLVRISTNESLGMHTWENVSIPSGGQRILQSAALEMEPYDLRVILDPDNQIDEMDTRNNIFETPVEILFEFTGLRVPVWPCEGFLHQHGEVWFLVSIGHGPSADEIQWEGFRVRYPETSVIIWDRNESPPPIYDLDGRLGFYFHFEMPADDNIYVLMHGYEQDGSTNQSMGNIDVVHLARDNYGAQEDLHHARSTGSGATECPAVEPTVSYFGFDGWWRITRLH